MGDTGMPAEQQNHLDTYSLQKLGFLPSKRMGRGGKIIRILLCIFCVVTFNCEASEPEVSEH